MTTLALNNVRPYGEDVTNILIDVTDGVIDAVGENPCLLYTSDAADE